MGETESFPLTPSTPNPSPLPNMRYLFTYDATKLQGGVQFTPVTRAGSQLYGTIQVEEGADTVLAAGGRWVKEISKEDFDAYEARRKVYEKSKTAFAMPDMNRMVLPKVQAPAPKPAVRSADVLTAKPVAK